MLWRPGIFCTTFPQPDLRGHRCTARRGWWKPPVEKDSHVSVRKWRSDKLHPVWRESPRRVSHWLDREFRRERLIRIWAESCSTCCAEKIRLFGLWSCPPVYPIGDYSVDDSMAGKTSSRRRNVLPRWLWRFFSLPEISAKVLFRPGK